MDMANDPLLPQVRIDSVAPSPRTAVRENRSLTKSIDHQVVWLGMDAASEDGTHVGLPIAATNVSSVIQG